MTATAAQATHRLEVVAVNRAPSHVSASAESNGMQNANVTTRSGGKALVSAATRPATAVNTAHATRNRWRNPRVRNAPRTARGNVTHGAYRVQLRRNRSR